MSRHSHVSSSTQIEIFQANVIYTGMLELRAYIYIYIYTHTYTGWNHFLEIINSEE
jgi:hypothetical protein